MRISDWSSDVCSSDLRTGDRQRRARRVAAVAASEIMGCSAAPAGHPARHARSQPDQPLLDRHEIGRASCRERVGQYVSISVVAVSLKKTTNHTTTSYNTYLLLLLFYNYIL